MIGVRDQVRFFLSFLFFFATSVASAQMSVNVPANTEISPCDEYATLVLNDPWDMSNNADINYYLQSDLLNISSTSFSSGIWSFSSTVDASGFFHLTSPGIENVHSLRGLSRYGEHFPVDTSKYNYLTLRMNNTVASNIKPIMYRGKTYTLDRTIFNTIPTLPGWRSYSVDLNSLGVSSGESGNTNPWSSGSITGIGFLPSLLAQAMQIDYIRLEDSSSCGSDDASFVATATSDKTLYNLYVDNDGDPSNGYYKKLATAATASGAGTISISSLGLAPGDYYLVGLLEGDFSYLEDSDWLDFSDSGDVTLTAGVSNTSTSGGSYNGTVSSTTPAIYVRIGSQGIDASKYTKLSFKLTRSANDLFSLFWTAPGGGLNGMVVDPSVHDADNDNVYNIDLGSESWSGTVSEFIVRPSSSVGSTFALDFVSFRPAGYVTELGDVSSDAVASTSSFHVNAPPIIKVVQPDAKGGAKWKPLNMRQGDHAVLTNLRYDDDGDNAGEGYTGYLPDVRTVGGKRGDFFKGTNEAGNDDPNYYTNFPFFNDNPESFSAEEYKNLCFTLNVDRDFDACLGSVTKMIYGKVGGQLTELDAFTTIYDFWSGNRWAEYCTDLTVHPREPSADGDGEGAEADWNGVMDSFRIDPHEFHYADCGGDGSPTGASISVPFYIDEIAIMQDSKAPGQYAIVYDVSDTDDSSPSVSFSYNSSASASGGTVIPDGDLDCEGRVCIWDTSSLANGTYYVYASASDGISSNSHLSLGRLQVDNSASTAGTSPVLSLEAPSASENEFCDSIQVKGYALLTDRYEPISAVQVFINGVYRGRLTPNEYSPNAVAAYPNEDSSNTGFNQLIDISDLAAGAHSVEVKAYSPDGVVASSGSLSFTKLGGGCSDPLIDPDPSGSPQNLDASEDHGDDIDSPDDEDGGSDDEGSDLTAPAISVLKQSKKGKFNLTIQNPGEADQDCTLNLLVGESSDSVTSSISNFSVASSIGTQNYKMASKKNVRINKKKVPNLYFLARKTCGSSSTDSPVKSLKVKSKRGGTFAKTVRQLSSRLVEASKARKKKKRKKKK